MGKLPKHLRLPGFLERLGALLSHNLNFYRIHMICFSVIPLIFSAIMWGCNTEFQVPFLDCMFVCYSCMCVTGLATIDLSQLSVFQQFLLYIQMLIGSMIFVSLLMLSVRKYFFRVQFRHVLNERNKRQRALQLAKTITRAPGNTANNIRRRFTRRSSIGDAEVGGAGTPTMDPAKKKRIPGKLTTDMIQRVDGGGVGLINPMGWYDGGTPSQGHSRAVSPDPDTKELDVGVDEVAKEATSRLQKVTQTQSPASMHSQRSDPATIDEDSIKRTTTTTSRDKGNYDGGQNLHAINTTDSIGDRATRSNTEPIRARTPYSGQPVVEDSFPRSKTIAFDDADDGLEHVLHPGREAGFFPRTPTARSDNDAYNSGFPRRTTTESMFPRTYSLKPTQSRFTATKNNDFGGFPTPIQLAGDLVHRLFPGAANKLQRSLTVPRSNTILSGRHHDGEGKNVDYITFSANVGRNSEFKDLTPEQKDELGGVEYRALRYLFWIVLCYWLFLPLAGAVIIAPYIAANNRYDTLFNVPNLHRHVRIPWFAFFQATSAFSNTGVSLVDQSMVPFQKAYLMSVLIMLLILLGNTCFPILLRFIIWVLFKLSPEKSQSKETLKFLLDHPRRCFVYLFPSTQTWFLVFVVFVLTIIDWVAFLVLDKGTEVIEALPVGTRVAAGLFQSCAVRAAGFVIVNMNELAPAVKVLYVVMMYISVYPIAMSVRSTNVYEERALGLYEDDEDEDGEGEFDKSQGPQAVAKYLGWHARRQLAFDMWWVAFALWLICIIERGALNEESTNTWFNVFNVLFEVVSGYGTVGLSLGTGEGNYSLCGSFRKLSKLVLIFVMIRGRHRGLPVAIDRAVMLPRDFAESDERAMEDRLRRSRSRMASSYGGDFWSQTGSGFPRTFTGASNTLYQSPLDMKAPTQNFPTNNNGNGHVQIVPPSPRLPTRRDSSPSAVRRHGRTMSHGSIMENSSNNANSPNSPNLNPTPTSLHFAAGTNPAPNYATSPNHTPTAPTFGSLGVAVTGSGFPSSSQAGAGVLSPLEEAAGSRRPTIDDSAIADDDEDEPAASAQSSGSDTAVYNTSTATAT